MHKAKITQKPKSYWDMLIKEVTQPSQQTTTKPVTYDIAYERRSIKYTLGEPMNVYFTQREAECMMHLLQGKTLNEVGAALNLSPRTVEYYLSKIKRKLNCRKKKEVIQRVSQTDFVKNFNKDPYNQK